MGRRHEGNIFLPGKWVFPGGRVEPSDGDFATATPLNPADMAALLDALPVPAGSTFAHAVAFAAVRELFEETGHAMALPNSEAIQNSGALQSSATLPNNDAPALLDGKTTGDWSGVSWPGFEALGLRPTLAPLRFVARAITPPDRPRRYDTRFFIADRDSVIEDAAIGDGEFTVLNWFTFEDARGLDLPNITRRVLADVEEILAQSGALTLGAIPYYYQENGAFRRELIRRGSDPL